jgi:urease accessory protein
MRLMRHGKLMLETGYFRRDTRYGIRDRGYAMHLVSCFSHLVPRFSHLASYVALLTAIWPATAFAHTQGGAAAGFFTGLNHPISGLDHVIAMVAVGLWGAQLGAPAVFLLPVAFPMVMAFGGALGLIGIPLPGIEIGIAISAVVLGVLVLANAKPQLWVALVVAAFFALFHGHAHGTELPPGQSGLLYSIGFVIATGLLHAFGISIGLIHQWPIGRTAIRAAGALVSVAGLVFLWRAVS